MINENKRKFIIRLIIGAIFSLMSLFFIADAILDSGNAIVILITLFIGLGFIVYGKQTYKKAKKTSEFKEWNE